MKEKITAGRQHTGEKLYFPRRVQSYLSNSSMIVCFWGEGCFSSPVFVFFHVFGLTLFIPVNVLLDPLDLTGPAKLQGGTKWMKEECWTHIS